MTNYAFQTLFRNGTETGNYTFLPGDEVRFSLHIREALRVWFYLGNDERVLLHTEVPFLSEEDGSLVFSHTLPVSEFAPEGNGLFFFHWEAETLFGRVYTVCTDGKLTLEDNFVNEYQLTVFQPTYLAPDWLDNGVFYHIFVDRFFKSGRSEKRPDAVYRDDWEDGIPEYPSVQGEEFPNNTHFGGDLYGILDKLDYLEDLGVSCLYLSPVCDAFSNHKYDTGDYLRVDRSFGGDEALRALCDACHARGMRVILDGVFNHVGNDSVYFNQFGKYPSVGAYQSQDSPYYSWFRFTRFPDAYESWWGIRNLPKTSGSEDFRRFVCGQVIPKYMALGADGFRLDVADELAPDFLEAIAASVKACGPDAALIGEVWEDASNKIAYDERRRYFRGKQLDGVMNYPLRNGLISFLKDGDPSLLRTVTETLYRHYPAKALAHTMNSMGTHDTERILTILGGDGDPDVSNEALSRRRLSEEKRREAVSLLCMGYTLLASLPGVPCIYYGDEAGTEGYHDPFNRKPFPWNSIDPVLHDRFRRVNRLRREEPLFSAEEFAVLDSPERTFAFVRSDGKKKLLVLSNRSAFPLHWAFFTDMKELLSGKVFSSGTDVPPDCTMIFRSL